GSEALPSIRWKAAFVNHIRVSAVNQPSGFKQNVKRTRRTLQRTRHKNGNVAGTIRFIRCLDSSNGPEELWLTMPHIWSQNRWKRFPKKCIKWKRTGWISIRRIVIVCKPESCGFDSPLSCKHQQRSKIWSEPEIAAQEFCMRSLKLAFLLLCAGYFSMANSGPIFAQSPTKTIVVKPNSEPPLAHLSVGTIVVKPKPFDGILVNPDIGFTTFQRFNGDNLNAGTIWTEGFPIKPQPTDGKLRNKDYPMTSIAYFRVYWRFVEPEEGVYNWGMLDKALQTAHARHQT